MQKVKTVMIDLTATQREKLKKATGVTYNEVELHVQPVAARAAGRKLATKAAPSMKLGKGIVGDYKTL